jgi:hypothetical protein
VRSRVRVGGVAGTTPSFTISAERAAWRWRGRPRWAALSNQPDTLTYFTVGSKLLTRLLSGAGPSLYEVWKELAQRAIDPGRPEGRVGGPGLEVHDQGRGQEPGSAAGHNGSKRLSDGSGTPNAGSMRGWPVLLSSNAV